jgi:hypothetical protein
MPHLLVECETIPSSNTDSIIDSLHKAMLAYKYLEEWCVSIPITMMHLTNVASQAKASGILSRRPVH